MRVDSSACTPVNTSTRGMKNLTFPGPFPTVTSTLTTHNGRETLGLRPALRQAALVCRRGRGRGGASGDQATVGRTTSPFGDSFGVCSPLPQQKGSAACLGDIPSGNVVSRWTLCAIPPPMSNSSPIPRHFAPTAIPETTDLATPFSYPLSSLIIDDQQACGAYWESDLVQGELVRGIAGTSAVNPEILMLKLDGTFGIGSFWMRTLPSGGSGNWMRTLRTYRSLIR